MEKHIAMCGLDCAKCDAFIVTKNNDDEMRGKVAKEWTERHVAKGDNRPPLKPQDINCRGCLSDGPIYFYCRTCNVRKCGLERGLSNCKDCSEYKCAMLRKKHNHLW